MRGDAENVMREQLAMRMGEGEKGGRRDPRPTRSNGGSTDWPGWGGDMDYGLLLEKNGRRGSRIALR